MRDLVNENLGIDNSALVVVVDQADWDATQSAMERFGGKSRFVELQGSSMVRLEQLTEDSEVTAVAEETFADITNK